MPSCRAFVKVIIDEYWGKTSRNGAGAQRIEIAKLHHEFALGSWTAVAIPLCGSDIAFEWRSPSKWKSPNILCASAPLREAIRRKIWTPYPCESVFIRGFKNLCFICLARHSLGVGGCKSVAENPLPHGHGSVPNLGATKFVTTKRPA